MKKIHELNLCMYFIQTFAKTFFLTCYYILFYFELKAVLEISDL